MKFAIVEGQRREAEPKLVGGCPGCGAPMLAKCGDIKVWHWAHRGKRKCDPWWENETEWHRSWKNAFPEDWQEIVHRADDGEKHIADVKTTQGRVIEFQNSPISKEERQSREAFYRPMCWVVNGLRRKRDKKQYFEALSHARTVNGNPFSFAVPANEGALLRDWADSQVPVFLDFGDTGDVDQVFQYGTQFLWGLSPKAPPSQAVLTPFYRACVIEALIKGEPFKGINFSKVFERAGIAKKVIQTRRAPVRTHSPRLNRRARRL
ncbi:MAG: competence protein CoiA family protein [Kiloniellaceae bacterium]